MSKMPSKDAPHAQVMANQVAVFEGHPPRDRSKEIGKQIAEPERYGGAKRFVPQLPGITELVIDFLAQGADFEITTVEKAIYEGNKLFERKEYLKAIDLFGIAYEVFRFLPACDRYFPVAHDCIVRRIIGWSILGKFDKGLEECLVALAIIPNSPIVYFFQGILYSKCNIPGVKRDLTPLPP